MFAQFLVSHSQTERYEDEIAELLERAIRLDPGDVIAKAVYAQFLYLRKSNLNKAEALLQQAQTLKSDESYKMEFLKLVHRGFKKAQADAKPEKQVAAEKKKKKKKKRANKKKKSSQSHTTTVARTASSDTSNASVPSIPVRAPAPGSGPEPAPEPSRGPERGAPTIFQQGRGLLNISMAHPVPALLLLMYLVLETLWWMVVSTLRTMWAVLEYVFIGEAAF
jgi:hypothetical protein